MVIYSKVREGMTKKELKEKYLKIAKKLGKTPSVPEALNYGITRAMVRHHFGNITNLQRACKLKTYVEQNKNVVYELLGVKDNER
jgi:hypothetical protein